MKSMHVQEGGKCICVETVWVTLSLIQYKPWWDDGQLTNTVRGTWKRAGRGGPAFWWKTERPIEEVFFWYKKGPHFFAVLSLGFLTPHSPISPLLTQPVLEPPFSLLFFLLFVKQVPILASKYCGPLPIYFFYAPNTWPGRRFSATKYIQLLLRSYIICNQQHVITQITPSFWPPPTVLIIFIKLFQGDFSFLSITSKFLCE
jgi:hypothetical protein